jgi:hypothetical protein
MSHVIWVYVVVTHTTAIVILKADLVTTKISPKSTKHNQAES